MYNYCVNLYIILCLLHGLRRKSVIYMFVRRSSLLTEQLQTLWCPYPSCIYMQYSAIHVYSATYMNSCAVTTKKKYSNMEYGLYEFFLCESDQWFDIWSTQIRAVANDAGVNIYISTFHEIERSLQWTSFTYRVTSVLRGIIRKREKGKAHWSACTDENRLYTIHP